MTNRTARRSSQRSASAWTTRTSIGAALLRRAHSIVLASIRGRVLPESAVKTSLIPVRVNGIGVTLYRQGVVGCAVSTRSDLDEAVADAAVAAASDRRYSRIATEDLRKLRLVVSVLYDARRVGPCRMAAAAQHLRLGRDSLAVSNGRQFAIFLDSVAPHHSWTRRQLVTALLRKARFRDSALQWTFLSTASWLQSAEGARTQVFGFSVDSPERNDPAALRADVALMGQHLASNLKTDRPRYDALQPITGWRSNRGTMQQRALAYCALWQAGRLLRRRRWENWARRALGASGGCQTTHQRYSELSQFRKKPDCTRAGWLLQYYGALYMLNGDSSEAETAFEIADWCTSHQDATSGAFVSSKEASTAVSTALVAAGMADAWRLASMCGEARRASRYRGSWLRAIGFARQLIIRPVDAPMLKSPALAIGGVRSTLTDSLIRMDSVSHLTIAVCKGLRVIHHLRGSLPAVQKCRRS
jgi:AMMECR1 domain-containing protein